MLVDSSEDEWVRLHCVSLNGNTLGYTGRGRCITDVGLAQASQPLNPTSHYFEIEIVDPGQSCYIAIGLAWRNYPKKRHPGWNPGSIAYHADDGKIFVGCGLGEEFGPKCVKGDTMGCGVMFPRGFEHADIAEIPENIEYTANEKDGRADEKLFWQHHYRHSHRHRLLEKLNRLDEEDLLYSDEEQPQDECDEEEEDFRNYGGIEDDGDFERWKTSKEVTVFFTRNGENIGQRQVCLPVGGFYPTVGMLSKDEKVKVDLSPLTG